MTGATTGRAEEPLRALLIGTAVQLDQQVGGLGSIPQVANNLTDLARALSAPHGLIPAEDIEVVQDPLTPQHVYQAIGRQPGTGTLLCYFGGHGMRADGRLCLALPNSVDRPPHQRSSSLPAEALFEQLGQAKRRKVIVVLDCCFAGLAFKEPAAADMHLLVAVGKANKAKYNGGRHTVFTAALLNVLTLGVPDGTRSIDLDTLYRRVERAIMRSEDAELRPHQRCVDDTGRFTIAPNRAFEAELTPVGAVARADYADEVGYAEGPARAVRLAAELVRDAFRSSRIDPGDLFRCRQDLASWTGKGGDAQGAVRQLEAMLAEDLAGVPAEDLDLAAQSLRHWRGRV